MKRTFPLFVLLFFLAPGSHALLDGLFYHPDHLVYTTPDRDGLAFEAVEFQSADGTRLSGWFIPAESDAAGTVIHFHGNAQNMSAHYSLVSWLPKNGFNLFMFDYRGYGQSEGKPSRRGVYEDSIAAIEYVKSRTDIDQEKLIVFGQSIGGANALAVVGNNRFSGIVGVVSDSSFATYKSVATDHAGLLKPLSLCLVGNRLSPEKYVAGIAPIPLLIIHGTRDGVVPYKHAERLYRRAGEPKQLWTVQDGGHISALGQYRMTYAPRLYALFMQWTGE